VTPKCDAKGQVLGNQGGRRGLGPLGLEPNSSASQPSLHTGFIWAAF
jgi:hypothetical protein